MPGQELTAFNEDAPLSQHQWDKGRLYLHSYGRLFPTPATLLHQMNQASLVLDTVFGIGASASNSFDQFIQTRKSLAMLIPFYIGGLLLVPLLYVVSRCRSPSERMELKMPVEDRWLISQVSNAIQNQVVAIKRERLRKKEHLELYGNISTFLLSLSLHLTYCCLVDAQKNEKAQANFFVENFDWLAPALIAGMLMGLALLSKCWYRPHLEKQFEARFEFNRI